MKSKNITLEVDPDAAKVWKRKYRGTKKSGTVLCEKILMETDENPEPKEKIYLRINEDTYQKILKLRKKKKTTIAKLVQTQLWEEEY